VQDDRHRADDLEVPGRAPGTRADGTSGEPEAAIPAALDLLGLFVTAAALDRVPAAYFTARQRRDLLRWEIDVILNGLAATEPEGVPMSGTS
jgi:hypothetical protein